MRTAAMVLLLVLVALMGTGCGDQAALDARNR